MQDTVTTAPAATSSGLTKITKEWLKPHSPCNDGYRWFLEKFPQGGDFGEVYQLLRSDRRYADADWLASKAFRSLDAAGQTTHTVAMAGADAARIEAQVKADGANPEATATTGEGANAATTGYRANAATTGNWANAATTGEGANAATTGNWANAATTGYRANAATTGYRANAATTGEGANAATTGYRANAATTGYRANAATTGYRANAATTGNWANAATTGEGANAATTGAHAVAAALGRDSKAKAGADGAITVVCRDGVGKLLAIRSSMVGQNGVKPDTWYTLDAKGEFVEVEEDDEGEDE